MKTMVFIVVSFAALNCFSQNAVKNARMKSSEQNLNDSLTLFLGKNNVVLGELITEPRGDSVFTKLLIVKNSDTLYKVENSIFSNKSGTDFQVLKKGFFGYKIVLKKNTYIVLSYLTNGGRNVSDDITIGWNALKNVFEVEKTP